MNEEELNKITDELINDIGVVQPSAAFTDNVMAALPQTSTQKQPEAPLIGKLGWTLIAAGIASLVGLVFLFPNAGGSDGQVAMPFLEHLTESLNNGLGSLSNALSTNSVHLVGGIALCALFFAAFDQLLKRRWAPTINLF